MKKYLLALFIGIGLLGASLTGTWNSTEHTGVASKYQRTFLDSVKITNADTITYSNIVISGTTLHGLYISTDDDSVKIQYRQNLTTDWTGDWTTLDSLNLEDWYTLYLTGYNDFLQFRLIGMGVDSTVVKLGIVIGSVQ